MRCTFKEGNNMTDDVLESHRDFLKDSIRLTIDFSQTDQRRAIQSPPLEKPADPDAKRISLPEPSEKPVVQNDITTLIKTRSSQRKFQEKPLTLDELGFLLWATQGIKKVLNPTTAFRTVPSAGCRHALETYLAVSNITGLDPGIYRYLPIEHQLLFERDEENLDVALTKATLGQSFVGRAPVTFIWTAIPYRMEWRYSLAAHKVILLDAGHVCQNLYLAAGAIEAGTCAIAAYHQELIDQLLDIDGKEEFTIYLAPVGKLVLSE